MTHPANRIIRDPAFLGRISRLYDIYVSDADLNEASNGLFTFLFDDLPLVETKLLNVRGDLSEDYGDEAPALDLEYVVLPEDQGAAIVDELLASLDFDYSESIDDDPSDLDGVELQEDDNPFKEEWEE